MQRKGCSGFVRHVMDVVSLNGFVKLLFETQPACFLECFLIFA